MQTADRVSSSRISVLRAIGRWDLAALMINVTIGAGILGLPARLYALAHDYSILVLIAAALLVGVVALCFAEVGSRFTDSGGPYLIARTALGSAPGFLVGWLYWISRVLTFATICNLLAAYAERLTPQFEPHSTRIVVVTAVVATITMLHLIGVRQATVAGNVLTLLKVALLGGFGAAGLLSAGGVALTLHSPPALDDLNQAALLAVFAFVGFEAAFVSAGETREPRRDTPFAVAAALCVVLVLYAGVQLVCMASVPNLAASTAPVADAAVALWGTTAQTAVAIAAITIMLGSLNAGFLATTRLPFAFAENGDAPAALGRVHERFRTPYVAILASGVLVLIATLGSSFLTAITLATSTRVIVYVAGCAALIVLRKRSDAPPAGFLAPYGRVAAVAAIALSLALLASASRAELVQLAAAAAIGIGVYAIQRMRVPRVSG